MTSLYNLLHASHFPGCKSDFDAAGVEAGCHEDAFHDAPSKRPGTLAEDTPYAEPAITGPCQLGLGETSGIQNTHTEL